MSTTTTETIVKEVKPKTPKPKKIKKVPEATVESLRKQLAAATAKNTDLAQQFNTLRQDVRNFKKKNAISKASTGSADDVVHDDVATGPVFMAANDCSPFLLSLVLPETGPASSPDDVVRLHTTRAETVTYNIPMVDPSAPTDTEPVSGIFILYPNHPTELIGYSYIFSPTDTAYGSSTKLTTAQQLAESYDYGRRTSQVLRIQSSTLPSGMYAINGTFNAVRVDGTASEMSFDAAFPSVNYGSLLQNTSNILDKLGNVSVGNGITVLSIPDSFVNPYTRLNDVSPSSIVANPSGFVLNANEIIDTGSDLKYFTSLSGTSMPAFPGGSAVTVGSIAVNIDSTTGVDFTCDVTLTNMGTTMGNAVVSAAIQYLDPFGIAITNVSAALTIAGTTSAGIAYNGTMHNYTAINGDFVPNSTFSYGPIASAFVTFSIFTSGAVAAGGDIAISVNMVASNAKSPGVNSPIVVVAFQSVAAQSVITLTGVSNFELIPNPELRRNITCDYGKYDPHEMQFVKTVVAGRQDLQIRSIWDSLDYEANKARLRALCECDHASYSKSFGWSEVLRMARKALPFASAVAKTIFPGVSGIADAITNAASSKSASGRAYRSRAAGYSVAAGGTSHAGVSAILKSNRPRVPIVLPKRLYNKATQKPILPVLPRTFKPDKAVAFPVITTDSSDNYTGAGLWCVLKGDFRRLYDDGYVTRANDGHHVYGLRRDGGLTTAIEFGPTHSILIDSDLTVLPIDPVSFNKGTVRVIKDLPPLTGHSCDAAIWLLQNGDFSGFYPCPVTGEIMYKDGIVKCMPMPNSLWLRKSMYLSKYGIKLLGNNPESFLPVDNLSVLRRPVPLPIPRSHAATLDPVLNLQCPPSPAPPRLVSSMWWNALQSLYFANRYMSGFLSFNFNDPISLSQTFPLAVFDPPLAKLASIMEDVINSISLASYDLGSRATREAQPSTSYFSLKLKEKDHFEVLVDPYSNLKAALDRYENFIADTKEVVEGFKGVKDNRCNDLAYDALQYLGVQFIEHLDMLDSFAQFSLDAKTTTY